MSDKAIMCDLAYALNSTLTFIIMHYEALDVTNNVIYIVFMGLGNTSTLWQTCRSCISETPHHTKYWAQRVSE